MRSDVFCYKEYNCGFTVDNKWFRYRAAAIIVEGDYVLFAGNSIDDYYYSIGGAVHINFFNENKSGLKGLDCHEIAFYFLMKSRGTRELNSHSMTQGISYIYEGLPSGGT